MRKVSVTMARITRLTKPLRRVISIDGAATMVEIGPRGMAFRPLGQRRVQPVLLHWSDLLREGGMLDEAEVRKKPLLKAAMRRCGKKDNLLGAET